MFILIPVLFPACSPLPANNPLPAGAIKYEKGSTLVSKKTLALVNVSMGKGMCYLECKEKLYKQNNSRIVLPAGTRFKVVKVKSSSYFDLARGKSLYITVSCDVKGKNYRAFLPWHISKPYRNTLGHNVYDTVNPAIFRVVSR